MNKVGDYIIFRNSVCKILSIGGNQKYSRPKPGVCINITRGEAGYLELPNGKVWNCDWVGTKKASLDKNNKIDALRIDMFEKSLKYNDLIIEGELKDVLILEPLSNKLPLSTQLERLTGYSWNALDWDNYETPFGDPCADEGNVIINKHTKQLVRMPFREWMK